ncbi:LAMI_0H05798g1_1 [Lachancea mirantina]|uniref:LAMI_0H05798g1_1 n=1 Tax=Lachancea mirantina TaxID=1230905 RepID=A0A1G4KFD4_9SACH|nr:LAMI_0H05798g1_1 [Lachancea mirantina]
MDLTRTLCRDSQSPWGELFHVIASVPTEAAKTAAKTPITFAIAAGSHAAASPPLPLAAYVYAVPRGKEAFATVLSGSEDDLAHETANRVALLCARRFGRPCYVALSAASTPWDSALICQECVKVVNDGDRSAST